MQIYGPKQLKDGGWHYTCSNGSGVSIYPLGYCCLQFTYNMLLLPFDELPEFSKSIYVTPEHYQIDLDKHIKFHSKYHVFGHATAKESTTCYHSYLVDQCLREYNDTRIKEQCINCHEWTNHRVDFRGDMARYCVVCESCCTPKLIFDLLEKKHNG